ncbi:TPA: hypothetical protein NV796_003816 [Escherichia coli]|nr:hypothetical protein [Escherichia coli]HCJ8856450.1 hypothetical protein [Escherichia coli]
MKRKVLAMLVPALLVADAANAAEIYNKDGNKLDLYGKMVGERILTDRENGEKGDNSQDTSYARVWICPYISRHLLSLNPLQARCRRYSRGER